MPPRPLLLAAVALGLGLAPGPGRVAAQPLEITPVQVELSSAARNEILTLHNRGARPMRFQVSAFAWRQDARGEMRLSPTKDVSFYPGLLTVGPGEKRNVRIAAAAPSGAVERTYRVFVEQLPDARPEEGGVRVLTRVGIPVFVLPERPARRADVAAPSLAGRTVTFTLSNAGNVRLRPTAVRLVGRDAAGAVVFERPLSTWYVLAQERRVFETEAPADACSRVRTLSAEVGLESGGVAAQLATPGGACAP